MKKQRQNADHPQMHRGPVVGELCVNTEQFSARWREACFPRALEQQIRAQIGAQIRARRCSLRGHPPCARGMRRACRAGAPSLLAAAPPGRDRQGLHCARNGHWETR